MTVWRENSPTVNENNKTDNPNNSLKNKIINLLTMCRKAGFLTLGFDATKEALAALKVHLIIIASDISPKTEKEIRFFASKTDVDVVKTEFIIDEFYFGIGKKVGILGICDAGFSKKLSELNADLNNTYTNP